MPGFFIKNGSAHITHLIEEAISNGTREITVTGNWEITTVVLIPSDFTVILKDCHLKMADNTFDNMFRNESGGDPLTRTIIGDGNKNIRIKGVGRAILDGGTYNGLKESNAGKDGKPPMYVNNLLLFVNVDNFEVSGIQCYNQRWWALCFIYCSQGYVGNIHYRSNDTAIDENGNEYHGLIRTKSRECLIRNADGIDLRHGCHHIKIENLTGFTQDDTVALTGLIGTSGVIPFETPGKSTDICFVEIKNIRTAAHCSNVRLLNQGGIKLHDILIDGVYDMSKECPYMDIGGYGVRVGDGEVLYGWRHSTEEETYNITVRNVRSRALDGAIHLGGKISNLVLENIEAFDGAKEIVDMRT